ncbi:unnamed protein product, partial [Phaeothamnion confervicola]
AAQRPLSGGSKWTVVSIFQQRQSNTVSPFAATPLLELRQTKVTSAALAWRFLSHHSYQALGWQVFVRTRLRSGPDQKRKFRRAAAAVRKGSAAMTWKLYILGTLLFFSRAAIGDGDGDAERRQLGWQPHQEQQQGHKHRLVLYH